MNKNPFVPPPPYPTHQQPPLPPGPPPPQPATQPDYSAYWAAQQQASAQPAFNPQWSAPNPPWPAAQPGQIASPPKPPTDQSAALYANYGYGGHQAAHWQQQQQHHYAQPPTAVAPVVPSQPYNPYQPQNTATYSQPPQPYMTAQPQTQAPTQQPFRPMQPPQAPQQPFFQQQQLQQQQQQQQPQHQPRPPAQHTSQHQQMPPAKRPRFDNAHQSGPQQGRFQQGSQSMQGVPSGPSKQAGLPAHPSQMQLQASFSGRGGMGVGRGVGMNRGGRGGSMGGNRGMTMNRGRGGATHSGGGRGGGLGHSGGGSLRGHQSRDRGGFNNFNRRGGSSFNNGPHRHHHGPPDRSNRSGGGPMHGSHGRSGRSEGFHRGASNSASVASASGNVKREENRRTLTDFKIVGLEIRSLGWYWGYVPPETSGTTTKSEETAEPEESAHNSEEPKEPSRDSDGIVTTEPQAAQTGSNGATAARMRIYFHTPPSADDAHPILPASSISDLRKGKRKKADDDEGDIEDGHRPPHPPPLPNGAESIDDRLTEVERGSVAPSVAETTSEGDWLMAAITDGDADAEGETEAYEQTQIESDAGEHGGDGGSVVDHAMSESGTHTNSFETKMDESVIGDGENSDITRVDSVGKGTDIAKVEVVKSEGFETSVGYASDHAGADGARAEGKSEGAGASSAVKEESFELIVSSIDPTTELSRGDRGKSPQPSNVAAKAESDALDKLTAGETDHLPEPPASPTSNTAFSGSSTSTSIAANPDLPSKPVANMPRVASPNRVSIAYAAGSRRLIIDSDMVERMIIFRAEGRIDIDITVERAEGGFKGILIETLNENKAYAPIVELSEALDSDSTLPPFWKAESGTKALLSVHLDKERPLSEPKWVKTGDVQDWLKDMFGGRFWVAGEAVGWEKKIEVRYPDPAPTIQTVLNSWASNSPVGVATERSRFIKTHMTEADNILEILLRLVRGERATPFSQTSSALSSPSIQGPLLAALDTSSPHAVQQTHVSLAVMAIVRLATQFAEQAIGEGKGKEQVEERVGEIIRSLPSHLLYKSLDGMFKEWRAEKKGGR
ncbi:PRE5_1 [Sanghuangporus vaninii]